MNVFFCGVASHLHNSGKKERRVPHRADEWSRRVDSFGDAVVSSRQTSEHLPRAWLAISQEMCQFSMPHKTRPGRGTFKGLTNIPRRSRNGRKCRWTMHPVSRATCASAPDPRPAAWPPTGRAQPPRPVFDFSPQEVHSSRTCTGCRVAFPVRDFRGSGRTRNRLSSPNKSAPGRVASNNNKNYYPEDGICKSVLWRRAAFTFIAQCQLHLPFELESLVDTWFMT